jgi:hypothetical protein
MLFLLFCLMIKGSESEPRTNVSGSGRPKNTWILRIRIWIRNTENNKYRVIRAYSILYKENLSSKVNPFSIKTKNYLSDFSILQYYFLYGNLW